MITFSEWMKLKEMLSPVPFPAVTKMSPEVGAKLKIYTAFNTGQAKVPRKKVFKQGSQDGDWR